MVASEQLRVALSYHGRELFVGGAIVHCEPGESPHAWGLVLRVSAQEAMDFAELRARQATVHVAVGAEGRGTAQLANSDVSAGDATHVQLTGMGFCPRPDH